MRAVRESCTVDDNDDEDMHRRRYCDSINSPLSDNLGQLIPSCSTCVIVQSYDSDSRCCRRDCCVTSLRRDVVSQAMADVGSALPSFESLLGPDKLFEAQSLVLFPVTNSTLCIVFFFLSSRTISDYGLPVSTKLASFIR